VAIVMFLPFQVAWLSQVSKPQRFVPDVLVQRGVARALVFSTNVVATDGESWAMFPPPPSPGLDDAVIYVRPRKTSAANLAFWRKHFPDRAAFVLDVERGVRELRPLTEGSERPITSDRR
jgi:hypothetical protein